jgi:ABC-2 type transport system permease protein
MLVNGIYVLWLRDLKRYFRARSRVIGSLGMPFFFLAFFSMGFRRASIPSLPENLTYIDFLTPGVVSMVLLFSGTFSGVSIVWDRQFGFLREIMVSPISRTTIALGRTLGGATTALLQGLLMLAVSTLIGFKFDPTRLPLTLFSMFLIAIAFTGTGIAISTFMEDIHGFQLVINFFVFPLFFLSGALFPIDELPELVKLLALMNPLTYGVDALRWTLTGFSEMDVVGDVVILSVYCFAIVMLASLFFSRTEVK